MSKWILVAGGAGFIGSHLCDYLVARGEKVLCVDNFVTGNKHNLAHLAGNKNFRFKKHDVIKPFDPGVPLKQVYNLASPASPVGYYQKPLETLLVGAYGVNNLLALARKHRARFLQASTSEVYGDPKVHPQREDYWGNVNPIGLRSCYDESKRYAEALVMVYRRLYNLDAKIIRIFNTYGPRMDLEDGRVVPNLVKQAVLGQPLTVYGDGSQTRSFCYVSDMVEGFHTLMNSKRLGPVNVGNPAEFTILAFAKKVKALAGSQAKIVFKPLPKDDPTRRKPDISKAWRELKWRPKVKIDEGMRLTIDYFRQKLV